MRPAEALDTHALLADVLAGTQARQYLTAMAELYLDLRPGQLDGDYISNVLLNHLSVADTYHLDARMSDAVRHCAETLSEVRQFGEFELPSAAGVLVLDEPWELIEIRGNVQRVNVVTWGPAQVGYVGVHNKPQSGLMFTLWQHTRYASDSFTQKLLADDKIRTIIQSMGGLSPIHLNGTLRDVRIGPYRHAVPEKQTRKLEAAGNVVADLVNSPLHLILATWELMAQTRANLERPTVERASVRRARRGGIPARVTVVTLRREEHTHETGTGSPLEWRVPVKPHTRHYWVRDPATGELVREQRDISGHWRGPEDAPVRVTDKVYTLRR